MEQVLNNPPQKIPAEEWVTNYSHQIQDLKTVWDFNQSGDMLLFDDAFEWSRPKTLTKPEHIEKYLKHLNERVGSFVADDGFIYITVQWQSGQFTYDPIYFRFRYSDLNPDEDFFLLAQDKWNNTHIAVNAIGMDTWKVQKDKQQRRVKDSQQSEDTTELMSKLMQGLTLTPQEFQKLARKGSQSSNKEYYSAYVARWINERKPRWAVNLSKYYHQPKHRAGLRIFKPSENELKQKVLVGLLNWTHLSI